MSVIPVTPLSIVSPPQNLQVFSGDTADFSVTATGGAPLVYQWYCSGSPLAGQTASSLRLVTVNTNQAGAYSVAVSNSCGRATNVSASLAVDVWELLRNGGFEANVGNGAIPTSWRLITNSDGAYPYAGLICAGNTLYGTATHGGPSGYGTLFSVSLGSGSAPQLTINRSGANVIVTWLTNSAGFTLRSTTNLLTPAVWSTVSPGPVVVNGQNTVTNPISGTQRFYRLSQGQ